MISLSLDRNAKMSFLNMIHSGANPLSAMISFTYGLDEGFLYRGLLYFAQSIAKKDPGKARQNSLATAGTSSPNLERRIKEITVSFVSKLRNSFIQSPPPPSADAVHGWSPMTNTHG